MQAVSAVYASPAAGPPGQPGFLNAAARLETDLAPEEVRVRLRKVEADLGRVRTSDRYAPRPIDLDLVLYDDLVSPSLRIPDPDLLERPYLAVVASELDPVFPHPVTREPLGALAARLAKGADLTRRPDVNLTWPEQDDKDPAPYDAT